MHIIACFGVFLSFPFFFFEKCLKSRFVIYIKEFFQVLTSQANIKVPGMRGDEELLYI